MGKRLYVGNLPFDSDEAGLRAAFGQDGRQVVNVHLVMDRDTGRPRGFAFIEMSSDEDAKKAIAALDGTELGGRRLRVNEAEDRRGPPRAGGVGAGGPRPMRSGGPAGGGGHAGDAGAPSGSGGAHGGGGGGGVPAAGGGGGGFSRPRPNWVDAPPGGGDAKKYGDAKKTRRKHDEDPDFGGRRGARRFDDDEDW
jgi:cold-inducible RNA-binding protein